MRPPLRLPDPSLRDDAAGVVLRPWAAPDAPALAAAWTDPEVARWTAVPAAAGPGDAARWIEGGAARRDSGVAIDLVIAGRDAGEVRGEVGLAVTDPGRGWAELGYWVAPPWRGTGVATAAVRLVAGWALGPALGLAQLYVRVDAGNEASATVARRAGFTPSGALDDGCRLWARRRAPATPGGRVPV